jgi:hypothetical protein
MWGKGIFGSIHSLAHHSFAQVAFPFRGRVLGEEG